MRPTPLLLLWLLHRILLVCQALPFTPYHHSLGAIKNSYIRRYEPAWYDASALRSQRRVRRDAASGGGGATSPGTTEAARDQPLILRVRALDKQWTMRLVRDANLFTKDAVFEGSNGPIDFDTSHSYTGTILEDENALVQGVVTEDGLLDGSVVTSIGEEFYIEPASRYLSSDQDTSPPFHTIAYRVADVEKPPQPTNCPSHALQLRRLTTGHPQQQQQQQQPLSPDNSNDTSSSSKPFYERLLDNEVRLHGGFYSKEPEEEHRPGHHHHRNRSARQFDTNYLDSSSSRLTKSSSGSSSHGGGSHLHKRATVDSRKTTCMLYLQADHQFFARYGTEEACIEVMTRHVQKVNSIYMHTDFNQDGRPDNISFMIKRVKVHSGDALRDPNYRFPGNYGVEKYLELFSEEDYDAFCLAYMFTYRDFEMGTLGLAWTGDLKNAGGVCEKNGHYRGSMKSLNTGLVTLLNYGKHVPPAVSHVTLAHEIGHNFGSPHDPEQCTPGGEDGNFIMFARATSGDKRNNNRFSPCSLNAINPVLNTKARSPKGCFTEPQASLCGNGVVEDGEECDCGWEEDCRDSCCFPQRRYPPAEEVPCTLTPGSVCSPSQGPCCEADCRLRYGDKCRDDNGCRDASFCDGRSPYCPPSINKPNKTICNQELVCFMGECTGSICLAYGLESCQCIPGPDDPATKACELCCRLPGENQPCLSSFDWNSPPYDIPNMYAKPGTPCNDYIGYCDVFQKCREVDPTGPLATLRKFLLSDENLASFRRWMLEHWYAGTVLIFFLISLMALTGKLLRKRPGSKKLKSVTIIHSSTTETVRLPPEGAEGVTVHPPAVRAKLPLSKKVREKRRRPKRKKEAQMHDKSAKAKRKRVAAAVTSTPNGVTPAAVSTQPVPSAPPEELVRACKRPALPAPPDATTAVEPPSKPAQPQVKRGAPKDKSASQDATPTVTAAVAPVAVAAVPPAAKKKVQQQLPLHLQQQSQAQRKKMEVIDYSKDQVEKTEKEMSASVIANGVVKPALPKSTKPVAKALIMGKTADPKSKVRSWLTTHCRVDAPPPAPSPPTPPPLSALPKSKSSPMNLQANPVAGLPTRPSGPSSRNNTRQVALRRLAASKSRSVGNLTRVENGATAANGAGQAGNGTSAATAAGATANNSTATNNNSKNERVRLQVVYKPPFKFTVKLRKADKVGQVPAARVVGAGGNPAGPRTGVLVRTVPDKKSGKKERKRKSIKPTIRASSKLGQATCIAEPSANSDLHTVPSDLEVLLSESEFLFNDT